MEEAVAPHLNLNQVAESRRRKFRFASMIVCVIAVACTLTGISLHIYNASGAVQVDLSRPGYQSVRKEATANTSDEQFSATGNLDTKAYSQFNATATPNVLSTRRVSAKKRCLMIRCKFLLTQVRITRLIPAQARQKARLHNEPIA